MKERYVGVKFKVERLKDKPCLYLAEEIIKTCRELNSLGIAPSYGKGNAGNVSVRTADGFLITPTAAFYDRLTAEQLVEVVYVDLKEKKVGVRGSYIPSSESIMHYLIYTRTDHKAVVHAHDQVVLRHARKLDVVSTKVTLPYGTVELAEQVSTLLKKHQYCIIKDHGIVACGNTLKEVMTLVRETHGKALELDKHGD
jgi:L-fuculose-phosphate aldolase